VLQYPLTIMMLIYFFYGLAFWGLGLAAFLQLRRGGDLPLRKQLPWLAAFGMAAGSTGWVDMFLVSNPADQLAEILKILRMILQPATGLLLLIFGWGILTQWTPLPAWVVFIPGVLIVPIAFAITYAATTFITPSPIEIPIDIWSRYLLYLPGSIMAGIGFLRQWRTQSQLGYFDVSSLMLGAGLAFLLEAFVVGLVVPAAPYGPASYYNYNRVIHNAFVGEQMNVLQPYGLTAWLDYDRVLAVTGLPIQFWRMGSAFMVTFFVLRGLDVFDAIRKRNLKMLQGERDRAKEAAYEAQIAARISAENWTNALVSISRRIAELDDVDDILLFIVEQSRQLLDSDFMGLAIVNDDNSNLNLKCYASQENSAIIEFQNEYKIDNPFVLNAFRTGEAYLSSQDEPVETFEKVCPFCDKTANALAVVTLDLDNIPIGVLWVARYEGREYSESDLVWLECLADQVDIAIKHGLMTSQLQSLSIVEERGRIAREMHDGLAQVLGYLNLQVQTLDALQKQGKSEQLHQELQKMRAEIQTAHADVRENILSLRTTLSSDKGLNESIEEYLQEFSYQTGIESQFINQIQEDVCVSSIAEVQLVCILQEALANVRKHAQAQHVSVSFVRVGETDNGFIQMTIQDDGVGFTSSEKKHSFGLVTMRERAQSVDGVFNVHSTPGCGTTVELRCPVYSVRIAGVTCRYFVESIMNIREWTLPVYTILMQLATGAFLTLWLLRTALIKKYSQETLDRISRYPLFIIFVTIITAMVGSHLHLSQPHQSFLAILNFPSSWLSREIVFNLLYFFSVAGLLDLVWQRSKSERWKTTLGWIAITLGLVTIYCMSRIYFLPVQVGWNTTYTIYSFFGSTLLLGVISLALLLMLDLKFAELRAADDVQIRREIFGKSLKWFTIAVAPIAIAIVVMNLIHLRYLAAGDTIAQTSLELLLGLYQPLFLMRIATIILGVSVLTLSFFMLTYKRKKISELLNPVYIACLLVLVGEILERFLFYATHVRVGI
jgi:signal transduction histidine kinase/DMSO reductase anchor subunit